MIVIILIRCESLRVVMGRKRQTEEYLRGWIIRSWKLDVGTKGGWQRYTCLLQYLFASLLISAAVVLDDFYAPWKHREHPIRVLLPAALNYWEIRICKNAIVSHPSVGKSGSLFHMVPQKVLCGIVLPLSTARTHLVTLSSLALSPSLPHTLWSLTPAS